MMGFMQRECAVDRHPLKDDIATMIASGSSLNFIEKFSREKGHPIKRETVKAHMERCLAGTPEQVDRDLDKITVKIAKGAPKAEIARDFAVAVQKKALHELKEGTLRVTTKDGLVAQQLLDKREERAKDRAFVLDLARLISGAGAPPPDEYIDGEYIELGEGNLLAPPELREGD